VVVGGESVKVAAGNLDRERDVLVGTGHGDSGWSATWRYGLSRPGARVVMPSIVSDGGDGFPAEIGAV